MGFGFLIPILIVGALVYVVMNGNGFEGKLSQDRRETDARQIINERYAKGELNEDEFEQMKKKLTD
ncbi:SHOCT domain-containing protein [Salisediminibacterium beveridgei]|uniref:SHOCT domain-containing protein n=1 Tax=Salisediminibacterium beveridgei TaxID=632773 RepID=UPI0018DB9903|nr:SHOCT domain-containing protein [Salisediminibacterium beveridgei]